MFSLFGRYCVAVHVGVLKITKYLPTNESMI